MSANLRRRGVAHQLLLVSENQGDCPLVWYQNNRSALFGFVTKHACGRRQTDRRTDRHKELRQLIPRYHSCSRGKNRSTFQFAAWNILQQERSGAGAGAEWAKTLVSGSGAVSGCEKIDRSGRSRSVERSRDRESQK